MIAAALTYTEIMRLFKDYTHQWGSLSWENLYSGSLCKLLVPTAEIFRCLWNTWWSGNSQFGLLSPKQCHIMKLNTIEYELIIILFSIFKQKKIFKSVLTMYSSWFILQCFADTTHLYSIISAWQKLPHIVGIFQTFHWKTGKK